MQAYADGQKGQMGKRKASEVVLINFITSTVKHQFSYQLFEYLEYVNFPQRYPG